jgi:pimeloyl-ACP methyl ester carboxylesterase
MKNLETFTFLVIMSCILVGCTSKDEKMNIEGIWEGTLKYPGLESKIVFIITSIPGGQLEAKLLRPDDNDDEIPASKIMLKDSDLRLEVESVKGAFEGQLIRERDTIEGQWKQGNWLKPLVLKRVLKVSKPSRPQTPIPPYPYDEKEVSFINVEANAKLSGTLTLPKTGLPCPAVILISGTGGHNRDYSMFGHRLFLVISDYLTRQGIAVLRFDDRGVGASSGDRSQATIEDYALDVLSGMKFLKDYKDIDRQRIGLVGHSEGGTIAALAAARSSDVAFIVMMGSPGLSGEEYNYQFEESMGRILGLSDEEIAAKHTFQKRVISVILSEKDRDVAEKKLYAIYEELGPQIPDNQKIIAMKRFLSPWFYFNISHDPSATLRTVKCPVLAVFAEKDMHVPPERNAQAIRNALETSGNLDYKVEELAGLNHFFQTTETGSPLEYKIIEETISPVALEVVGNWILEHVQNK